MQQRLNLPFDPYNLQNQVFQYRNDSPPRIPNINVPPQLMYIYPLICSMVANEVGANATRNSPRVFQFNQVSFNNFNNSDYETLLTSVIDIIMLYMMDGRAQTPEAIVGQCVSNVVTIHCCMQVARYPDLASLVDHKAMQEVTDRLAEAGVLQNQIMNMKSRMNGGNPNMMPQPAFVNHNYPNQQNNIIQNQRPINAHQANNFPSPFSNQQVTRNVQSDQVYQQATNTSNKYSYLNKQPQVVKLHEQLQSQQQPQQLASQIIPSAVVAEPQQVNNASPTQEKIMAEKEFKREWAPTSDCPFMPAFDPSKQKFTFTRYIIDGKTRQKAIIKVLDENMDREQHSLVTTSVMASTAYVPPNFSTRGEALEKSLLEVKADEEEKVDETIEGDEKKVVVSKNWKALTFLDELIFSTRLSQRIKFEDDACTTYRNYAMLGVPFITGKENKTFIPILSGQNNFFELSDFLKRMLDSPKSDNDRIMFINKLDSYLTKELTRVIRSKFSISISIDSFIDDSALLETWFRKNSGDIYGDAYKDLQKDFIKTFVNAFDINERPIELQLRNNLSDDDGQAHYMPVVLLKNCYSVTCVQINSKELNVAIPTVENTEFPGRSCMIPESHLPILYKFAKNLFEEAEKENVLFAHHLLVTSDDKIYELNKSILGFQECFLINEFIK